MGTVSEPLSPCMCRLVPPLRAAFVAVLVEVWYAADRDLLKAQMSIANVDCIHS